jgi:hypothetical protein
MYIVRQAAKALSSVPRLSIAAAVSITIISTSRPADATDQASIYIDQGHAWDDASRAAFYTQDQGSQIMPLAWFIALKQAGGTTPFLKDSLSRYGYLPNPANADTTGLPVGFTSARGKDGKQFVGMTCSACHTRQISVDGKDYRIDGGPAIVDFQKFLTELDVAVGWTLDLGNIKAFEAFARAVLGESNPDLVKLAALRAEMDFWYKRYHTLVTKALPKSPWGPSRLDAVGMIFNRLTGLDIGHLADGFLIPDNIQTADAPTRYPFLWNASKQNKTQWPGFADNGTDLLALSRNLGEVYGVFGTFEPKPILDGLLGIDYLSSNSANFEGLGKLEDLIKKIGPPKWPWSIDADLALKGKDIFNGPTDKGGCVECHAVRCTTVGSSNTPAWDTPLLDVGTDTREYDILGWKVTSAGVLKGAEIPFLTGKLEDNSPAFDVLKLSVLGAILQEKFEEFLKSLLHSKQQPTQAAALGAQRVQSRPPEEFHDLEGAFRAPSAPRPSALQTGPGPVTSQYAYESRVLQGIWAAAPYLHNGSVASLTELLTPAKNRKKAFKIGPAYDTKTVGLATEQTEFDYILQTTDCSERNSGNSRCGHEFGTGLSPDQKAALLEYLKTL